MSVWRPPQQICVKAIGLHWREGSLLAAEVLDDRGAVKGVRPLGGTVEFGETLSEALIRELEEELAVRVTPLGDPFFFENIYNHEGAHGHEIVAVFDISFPADAAAERDKFEFTESNGEKVTARWFDIHDLDEEGYPALYPSGLKQYLLNRRGTGRK